MSIEDKEVELTILMPFVEKLREGYDLVMGNRYRIVDTIRMPELPRNSMGKCMMN